MITLRKFKTLVELFIYFKDEQVCRDYLEMIRWNGNIQCPHKDCRHKTVFKYSFINHGNGQYVNGSAHTNTIEGFWSLLKRGIDGIYHHVSEKHLQRYVDEFVFRYNTKNDSEDYRFDRMLNNINSPLSYKQLCTN